MKTINNIQNWNKGLQFVICINAANILVPDRFKGLPVIMLLLLVVYRYFKLDQKPIIATKTYSISISFFLILLLSIFYTSNVTYGLRHLETSLSLIVFPTVFYIISDDKKVLNKNFINTVKKVFILSVIIFLVSTFTYFYISEPYYVLKSTIVHYTNLVDIRIDYYKIHPIYLSIYIGAAIIFTASLIKTNQKENRFLFHFILLILLMFMVILNKKGPILSICLIGLIYLFKNAISKRKTVSISLGLVVFISAIIFMPKYRDINRFEELLSFGQFQNNKDSSTNIRLQIYNCSLKLIAQSPFFGYGWGDVKAVLNSCYIKTNENLLKNYYNSHNQFLSILLSSGLIGFSAFIYYLFYLFKVSNINNDQVLFFLVLFFTLNMLSENILEREDGVIIFSFLINLYIFSLARENTQKTFHYD